METTTLGTRAVTRKIEPGTTAMCAHCSLPVKFQAKKNLIQVIANVYEDGKWNRVEHFHSECYGEAEQPHGEAEPLKLHGRTT